VKVSSPVLLAHEQVEGVLRPQEVVVVQDFHGTHPVGIEVTRDLTTTNNKCKMNKTEAATPRHKGRRSEIATGGMNLEVPLSKALKLTPPRADKKLDGFQDAP